jgi:hypothetical protein
VLSLHGEGLSYRLLGLPTIRGRCAGVPGERVPAKIEPGQKSSSEELTRE